MNITDQELEKPKAAKNAVQWNSACDEIKNARGKQYPPDWYEKVLASGMASRIQSTW